MREGVLAFYRPPILVYFQVSRHSLTMPFFLIFTKKEHAKNIGISMLELEMVERYNANITILLVGKYNIK